MPQVMPSRSAAESSVDHRSWTKKLPYSKMVYPDSFSDRLKYAFWRVYTPLHPFLRDSFVSAGIVKLDDRQDFLLGRLSPDESLEELVSYLISEGYGNHFVALKDPGEIIGLRKVEDFKYQYHIRIFSDGEVRGHYEFTPECYPILHYKKVGQEDRSDVFLKLLGDRITSAL